MTVRPTVFECNRRSPLVSDAPTDFLGDIGRSSSRTEEASRLHGAATKSGRPANRGVPSVTTVPAIEAETRLPFGCFPLPDASIEPQGRLNHHSTHGTSGTARHYRLRQVGNTGAAKRIVGPVSQMSCRFRVDSPVAGDGTPPPASRQWRASWVVPGYALARSSLDGSELFPVYLTTGPDPGLVVSTGVTAVPPIQLPVGVTAGGAEVLSCTTCSPK